MKRKPLIYAEDILDRAAIRVLEHVERTDPYNWFDADEFQEILLSYDDLTRFERQNYSSNAFIEDLVTYMLREEILRRADYGGFSGGFYHDYGELEYYEFEDDIFSDDTSKRTVRTTSRPRCPQSRITA